LWFIDAARTVRLTRSGFDKLPGAIWSATGARRVSHKDVRKTFPPPCAAIGISLILLPKGMGAFLWFIDAARIVR
jgi:hypothetical protein